VNDVSPFAVWMELPLNRSGGKFVKVHGAVGNVSANLLDSTRDGQFFDVKSYLQVEDARFAVSTLQMMLPSVSIASLAAQIA
jgi:hypothetical protein